MTATSAFPERRAEGRASQLAPLAQRNLGHILSVAAHAALFAFLAVTTQEIVSPLDSFSVDLTPQGDTMQSEDAQETEVSLAQPKPVEQPDPEATPRQSEPEEHNAVKKVEQKQNVARSDRRQQASVKHRLGADGGRANSMSRASYLGLLAAAIGRHTPSVSTLGAGSAVCHFTVTSAGAITGVSCTGTTPGQAALLRAAIFATRTPGPPPGGALRASQPANFH